MPTCSLFEFRFFSLYINIIIHFKYYNDIRYLINFVESDTRYFSIIDPKKLKVKQRILSKLLNVKQGIQFPRFVLLSKNIVSLHRFYTIHTFNTNEIRDNQKNPLYTIYTTERQSRPTSANLYHLHEERTSITRIESFKHGYYVLFSQKSILFFQGYSRLTFHLKKKTKERKQYDGTLYPPKFRIQTIRSQFFEGISFTRSCNFRKTNFPKFRSSGPNIVHSPSCK